MEQIRDCEHCVHYKEYKEGIYACEKWECEYEAREEKALENLASAKTVTNSSRRVEMVCDLIKKRGEAE